MLYYNSSRENLKVAYDPKRPLWSPKSQPPKSLPEVEKEEKHMEEKNSSEDRMKHLRPPLAARGLVAQS
jgi:hypothetical protein